MIVSQQYIPNHSQELRICLNQGPKFLTPKVSLKRYEMMQQAKASTTQISKQCSYIPIAFELSCLVIAYGCAPWRPNWKSWAWNIPTASCKKSLGWTILLSWHLRCPENCCVNGSELNDPDSSIPKNDDKQIFMIINIYIYILINHGMFTDVHDLPQVVSSQF